jgi:type I restriction enzyme R subunit
MGNQDLRHVFEKAEYRVMIVANKFQTGFNQPKLVAMYLDKKISGVDAVQTLSRLNRTYPGKDTTFVIDFANDPVEIRKAFKKYDTGVEIEDIQSLDVVYDKKALLDEAGIYNEKDLEDFKEVNAEAFIKSRTLTGVKQANLHKRLYAATSRAVSVFNEKMSNLNDSVKSWDESATKAHDAGDEKAYEIADGKRSEATVERELLMRFKSNLQKFEKTYTYIAQLIELGDPELENFSSFTKLLSRRLQGIPLEKIDLTGMILKGYAINPIHDAGKTDVEFEKNQPLIANDSKASDREKEMLSEVISRLNAIFGDIGDNDDHVGLTSDIVTKISQDSIISSQIDKNTKEQALEGDIKTFIKKRLIESGEVRNKLVRVLLSDTQHMDAYAELIYDAFKERNSALMYQTGI